MKKILFSGFEPFGDDVINPSLEAVKLLQDIVVTDAEICIVQTPVVRRQAIDTVIDAMNLHQPDAVVTVGQAGGRIGITPERVAINIDDYRIPDNAGNQPVDEPVEAGAPDAYFSTLPIKAMVQKMQERHIPASVSNSAGTFVCNHLFYGIQHYIASNNLPIRHGFVHIPFIPEQVCQANEPAMSLPLIVEGLVVIAETICATEVDIKLGAGTIC